MNQVSNFIQLIVLKASIKTLENSSLMKVHFQVLVKVRVQIQINFRVRFRVTAWGRVQDRVWNCISIQVWVLEPAVVRLRQRPYLFLDWCESHQQVKHDFDPNLNQNQNSNPNDDLYQ